MKTPLIFKLLLILVLALKLIKINKKKPDIKANLDFESLGNEKIDLRDIAGMEEFKKHYRANWINEAINTKEKALMYLIYKFEKYKSIFKFMWMAPELVVPFYGALKFIQYDTASQSMELILKSINNTSFLKLKNNEKAESEDFIPEGNMPQILFENFDKAFDLNDYLSKMKIYVAK